MAAARSCATRRTFPSWVAFRLPPARRWIALLLVCPGLARRDIARPLTARGRLARPLRHPRAARARFWNGASMKPASSRTPQPTSPRAPTTGRTACPPTAGERSAQARGVTECGSNEAANGALDTFSAGPHRTMRRFNRSVTARSKHVARSDPDQFPPLCCSASAVLERPVAKSEQSDASVKRETSSSARRSGGPRGHDQVAVGLLALAIGLHVSAVAQVLVHQLALARGHRVQSDRASVAQRVAGGLVGLALQDL